MSDTTATTTETTRDVPASRAVQALDAGAGQRRVRNLVLAALGVLVVWATPLFVTDPYLLVLNWVMVGAVGALGLTMLIGQAGQLSLAHSFFILIGGMSYAVLAGPTDGDAYIGFGLPAWIAAIGAVAITGGVGAAFAPISGRVRGIYLGVASLSLVFLGYWLARTFPDFFGSTSSGRYAPRLEIFGFNFGEAQGQLHVLGVHIGKDERMFWLFAGITALAYFIGRGTLNGRIGRGWRALRDNEAVATVMGVPVARQRANAFAISSAYAGLAGVMVVWWYDGLLKPDESVDAGTYSTVVAISFLAMCVIGGLGSLPGAVLGAAVVFGLPLLIPLLQGESGDLSGTGFTPVVITNLLYGGLIVFIIIFEPGGAAGIGRRLRGMVRR
ncbi:branched-chain amino acid ABC transporter permease [Demetria terragena]|uniref:branched-chain amino acid ABC transporter permease n=1 Tax=Demetria terragena TaxID=63959 RepID=UPI0003726549|nr:branched-chain amino acid ABC transporter permease [Demetria terragena]